MNTPRISIGISGLDEIVSGGLPERRSYLVVGSAGSGKTILSLQFLMEGQRRGERTVYVTLAEPSSDIARDADSFGWSLDGIEFVDLLSDRGPTGGDEYHVFRASEVEHVPVWQGIYDTVARCRPQRLVIDSLTHLRFISTDEYQFRKQILTLINHLSASGCTSLMTYEPAELEREAAVGLATDGVIRLNNTISAGVGAGLRSVQVEKLRGSDFLSGRHPLRIRPSGIEVHPHWVEQPGRTHPGQVQIPSGIAALDELLGGGLDSGTTTLLSGPAGVGKSSLGLQFLVRKVAEGGSSVMYTFEESEDSVLARSRGIGIPVEDAIRAGRLRIVRVNPIEFYPDEFLGMVRRAVEQGGVSTVMVDSLRGYELAMEEFGMAKAHIHNLVAYLSGRGVTTVLVSEVEYITSADLPITDQGVSHLADTVLLLRYAETGGEIIKVVSCLKKRVSGFQPELRQLTVDAAGIHVGEKLRHLRGVLSGAPSIQVQRE
ncbi:MAG: ATPase domain-containing protein [Burkholderiales bacterium]